MEQKTSPPPRRWPYFIALPGLIALLWFGLLDRPDPVWIQAGQMVQCRYRMLDEAVDSIQLLFN